MWFKRLRGQPPHSAGELPEAAGQPSHSAVELPEAAGQSPHSAGELPEAAEPPSHSAGEPHAVVDAAGERSVAAGQRVGIASTGDHAVNVLTRAEHATVLPPQALVPMAELSSPAGLINLPPYAAAQFVGRGDALDRLDAALRVPGRAVVQAVHGLGGIGKSTLAAHWAATRGHGHDPVWWITADSPAALDTGLAGLATALRPELSGLLSMEALRERAVQWLAAHEGWLLVLDNVNDPADIRPLLSRTRGGRFLITSRRTTGWDHLAVPVPLAPLDRTEALDLLGRILAADPSGGLEGAEELCAELGGLPLALEQAGSYIAETGITARGYLDLLAGHPAGLFTDAAEGTDPARTVARIWHVTFDHFADDPLTGTVLRTLAWFAPDHLPRHLLDGLAEPSQITRSIGRLVAHGLVTAHAGTATLSVHRLVGALARTADPQDPYRRPRDVDDARTRATGQLVRALPDGETPEHWPAWRALLPHIDALISHANPDSDTDTTADLLHRTGGFLRNQGASPRGIAYARRALTVRQRTLGKNHLLTLNTRIHLAYAYQAAGDLEEAIALFEQSLVDRLATQDIPRPGTPGGHTNLAASYEFAGDHLRRAMALHAYANGGAGHLEQSVRLHERILATRRRALGDGHPDTLASQSNLADALRAAGDPERAALLDRRTLARCVRELGADHPLTGVLRNKLGAVHPRRP